MNIAYFTTKFPLAWDDDRFGGAERVAYNLAINMASRGHKVIIFTISNKNLVKEYGNIVIFGFKTNFHIFNRNISLYYLFKPLRVYLNVDIVHLHTGSSPLDIASLLYAKKKKKPLVVTYHGDTIISYDLIRKYYLFRFKAASHLFNLVLYRLMKNILDRAEVIISPSKNYIRESRLLPSFENKIRVIPNGIDVAAFNTPYSKDECRRKLGLAENKKIILFLSAVRYAKGPDILVKALAEVIKRIPKVQLILAGQGDMEIEIKHLINRIGIGASVITTGFIKEAEKPLYYKAADVFVLPSREDCSPIVIFEAMASGIPIIATNVGGIPEIIQDGKTGLLVPPDDPNPLGNAITYLLTDESLRKRLANNAREKAKEYSWEKISELTEKLYEELI